MRDAENLEQVSAVDAQAARFDRDDRDVTACEFGKGK